MIAQVNNFQQETINILETLEFTNLWDSFNLSVETCYKNSTNLERSN